MSELRLPCAFCAEPVRLEAHACPHCQRDLDGPRRGEVPVADASARRGIAVMMAVQLLVLVLLLVAVMR